MTDDQNSPDGPSPQTVAALETLIGHVAVDEALQEHMNDVVFPLGPLRSSALELGKRHRETLRSSDCRKVLMIIWKESPFVTDEDLKALGYERLFGKGLLNCNSLGHFIARDKDSVGKSIQRVQNYVAIATAYRLVTQTLVRGRQYELIGTQQLHDMFVAIGSAGGGMHVASPSPLPPTISPEA